MNKAFWGNLKQVVVQLAIYFSPISWGMMCLTAWHTTISPQLRDWGYDIPIWIVVVVGLLTVIIVGFIEYRYSLPSYFASYNKQMYTANSPVMMELAEIKKLLKEKNENI